MSNITAETYDPFAGDGERAQILRVMRELSDGATVEYKSGGRSKIKFMQYETGGWRAYHEVRYDQVDVWSLLDLLRSFGEDTSDVAGFIEGKFGIVAPGGPAA